jgi:quercetin dioxygenase-like cupin family protein
MPNHTIVLSPEDRPRSLPVLGEQITVLAATEQTGGVEIFFQSGPEGSGPPPHHHDWDEAFYILRGELTFDVEGDTRVAGPGTAVFVPGGTVHQFRMGAGGAEMLSITSGPGASALFTAIAAEAASKGPDSVDVAAIVTAHGATLVLPAQEAVDA